MIFVSTDKAVNPSSGMGLTKRVAEIYLQGKAQRHPETRMGQVRFGNVFGSSGSVVPLFRRQIAHGGPVTVTDTEMTRYIMTIKEAVGLTLCAANLNVQGGGYGIYVLDMGQPIKIIDIARQLIEQSGLRLGIDIEIKIIGLRPGEKLHEELSYAWEALKQTRVPRVMKANTTFDPRKTLNSMDLLLGAAERRDARAVKDALLLVVPEYVGEVTF
jgi:O-antigen biosynthesis protein WbqV